MFGYVITNADTLPKESQTRFRSIYCGLCRSLRQRYGAIGQMTLSFDMTFLAMVLNSLYEPEENIGTETCLPHPFKKHSFVQSTSFEYAADMNIALAYHKCLDNWKDEHSLPARMMARMLSSAYRQVEKLHPTQCGCIEKCLDEIQQMEKDKDCPIDLPVNVTGRMLGEVFVCGTNDLWTETLREMGDGLGRFIYFMDSYDDLPKDVRMRRFNPLIPISKTDEYEAMCRSSLMMMIGDCTRAFELLPIIRDADIIRNILYSGVWSRYAIIQKKRMGAHK